MVRSIRYEHVTMACLRIIGVIHLLTHFFCFALHKSLKRLAFMSTTPVRKFVLKTRPFFKVKQVATSCLRRPHLGHTIWKVRWVKNDKVLPHTQDR